jgi:hypothetical protein
MVIEFARIVRAKSDLVPFDSNYAGVVAWQDAEPVTINGFQACP